MLTIGWKLPQMEPKPSWSRWWWIMISQQTWYCCTSELLIRLTSVDSAAPLWQNGELTSNNLLSIFISVSDANTGTKFSISALPLKCHDGIFWRLAVVSPSDYFQLGQVIHLKNQRLGEETLPVSSFDNRAKISTAQITHSNVTGVERNKERCG